MTFHIMMGLTLNNVLNILINLSWEIIMTFPFHYKNFFQSFLFCFCFVSLSPLILRSLFFYTPSRYPLYPRFSHTPYFTLTRSYVQPQGEYRLHCPFLCVSFSPMPLRAILTVIGDRMRRTSVFWTRTCPKGCLSEGKECTPNASPIYLLLLLRGNTPFTTLSSVFCSLLCLLGVS